MYDSIYDYNFDGKLDSFELALKQDEEDRECAAIFGRSYRSLFGDDLDGIDDLDNLDELDDLCGNTDGLDDGDF